MTSYSYLLLDGVRPPTGNDWLGPTEAAWLAGPRSPKRIAEWRLGRWTAKHTVSGAFPQFARPAEETAPVFPSVEILAEDQGAPYVVVDGRRAPLTLSLSHRAGAALCFVGAPEARLGCDLERVEPRSAAFLATYLTLMEQDAVRRAGDSLRPLLANLIWSAKESALKAGRRGLRVDAREVEVEVEVETGNAPLSEGWGRLTVGTEGRSLAGRWRQHGELILTVVSEPEPERLAELTCG